MHFLNLKIHRNWILTFCLLIIPSLGLADHTDETNLPSSLKPLFNKAKKGGAESQYRLGLIYEKGQGIPRNDKSAMNWYKPNDQKAFEWYLKAAYQDHARAQAQIGYMYRNGFGIEKDAKAAFEWYQKSAKQEFDMAQYILGELYEKGEGVTKNIQEAIKCYQAAAKKGFWAAEAKLISLDKKRSIAPKRND